MNLLFTRFPLESAYGGAEVQTSSLMRALHERGHHVEFIGSCPTLFAMCKEHHLEAEELDIGPPPVTKTGVISFWWRRNQMQQQLEAMLDGQPNLEGIFMLSFTEKLLLTPIAHTRGIRCFWLEHDRIGRWLRRNPWLNELRRVSQLATTVCVSELSTKLYHKLGWLPDHTVAIPNGVDPSRFAVRKRLTDTREALNLGCVARLTPDKGVDVLIEAMRELEFASLRILGRGSEELKLREQIRKCNLEDRVVIINSHRDLGEFYQTIDALVLPSRDHDPFGLVAAEAMLLDTPVIVTDACGIADYLINKQDAIVVPAGNSEALSEALLEMRDPEFCDRLAKTGQQKAQQDFVIDRMVERYEQLLLTT